MGPVGVVKKERQRGEGRQSKGDSSGVAQELSEVGNSLRLMSFPENTKPGRRHPFA